MSFTQVKNIMYTISNIFILYSRKYTNKTKKIIDTNEECYENES